MQPQRPAERSQARLPRRRETRALIALLSAGTIVRTIVAFRYKGVGYDIDSLAIVGDALRADPLDAYATGRWPYPPGYFPWIRLAGWAADATGTSFHGWIKLPAIAADAGLALLVHAYLRHRGVDMRRCLAAAALVALGPSFALISGYQGQIDSVAILPAAVGVVLWERRAATGGRALPVGVLLGIGAVIKTVPVLLVLALLPTRRSNREGAELLAATAVVPLVALLPFLWHDLSTVREAISYSGVPGVGGLSLVVQPTLADNWFGDGGRQASELTFRLWDANRLVLAVALLGAAVVLFRRKLAPVDAAVLIWLVVYVAGSNFFFQYVVWGLPFLLLADKVVQVAVAQALLLLPTVGAMNRLWSRGWLLAPYEVAMIAAWVAVTVACVAWARSARSDESTGAGTRPGIEPAV